MTFRCNSLYIVPVVVLLPVLITGCAYISEKAPISYSIISSPNSSVLGNNYHVSVHIIDSRPDKSDYVGYKVEDGRNLKLNPDNKGKRRSLGINTGPVIKRPIVSARITSTRSVTMTVRKAIERELENTGFIIGSGGAIVRVELITFLNDWEFGWFSGSARSVFRIEVSVVPDNNESNSVYFRSITGSGSHERCQLQSGANAGAALSMAFESGLHSLMNDGRFINSIVKAANINKSKKTTALPQQHSGDAITLIRNAAPIPADKPTMRSSSSPPPTPTIAKGKDTRDTFERDNDLDKYRKLRILKEEGMITEDEYEAARKRLVDKLLNDTSP